MSGGSRGLQRDATRAPSSHPAAGLFITCEKLFLEVTAQNPGQHASLEPQMV